MRKLSIVILLVLLLVISCRKESNYTDLLFGSWIAESDSGHPRPAVDFNTGGVYCMVDYINVPFGGTAVYKCTITGEFSVMGNIITLLTANVESMEDGAGVAEFPFEGVAVSDGSPIGSFYGGQITVSPRQGGDLAGVPDIEYEPVGWEIIRLTDSLLEVKAGIEIFRYVRR